MLQVNYKLTNATKGIGSVLEDVVEANNGTNYIERLNAMTADGQILYRGNEVNGETFIFISIWISREVNEIWTEEVHSSPLLSQFDNNLRAMGYVINIEKTDI